MIATLEIALSAIPDGLRLPLLSLYADALSDYRAARWESVGTKAGKISEVIYSIIAGKVAGSFPDKPAKPSNMVDACRALEAHNKTHGRSMCIQIPKVLVAVYEIRNNREIGHVGSDVNPNHMDAEFLIRSIKWLVAELVRVFGNLQAEEARKLIESVTERTIHVVWSEGDVKRVLNPSMKMRDRVLVLLYSSQNTAQISQLFKWCGYKNITDFKKKLLALLDKEALVHLNGEAVTLLPSGVRYVEANSDLLAI